MASKFFNFMTFDSTAGKMFKFGGGVPASNQTLQRQWRLGTLLTRLRIHHLIQANWLKCFWPASVELGANGTGRRKPTSWSGLLAAALLAVWLGWPPPAGAKEPERVLRNTLHVFAGQYTTGSTGDSANVFGVDYEDNYVLAAAYTREFWYFGWRFHLGAEAGVATRAGEDFSLETWGGLVLRNRGVTLGEWLTISPALAFGVSGVTEPIGLEAVRETNQNGDATWLFYLGPEIAFSLPKHPRWELVYRLHHRSGANNLLGGMAEGHNANTLGLRWRF
jgi:hypothetical protein